MTPDLLEQGARRVQAHIAALAAQKGQTESGGRNAGFGRVANQGEVDVTHGRILYLEDVHVSFDGFKAINGLSLDIAPGELRCIMSLIASAEFQASGPVAPMKAMKSQSPAATVFQTMQRK